MSEFYSQSYVKPQSWCHTPNQETNGTERAEPNYYNANEAMTEWEVCRTGHEVLC